MINIGAPWRRADVAVVVFLWLVARVLATALLAPSNDIEIYRAAAHGWLPGSAGSHSDWAGWEYPPLALVVVTIARALALPTAAPVEGAFAYGYAYAFAAVILAFDAVNVWLTSRLSQRPVAGALLYVAASALLGELLVQRLDVPVATTIALALVLALRRPSSRLQFSAELVLAAGALLKLVPLLVLPAVWLARRSTHGNARAIARSTATTIAAIAVGLVPFVLLLGGDAFSFIGFQSDRGLQIESVPAMFLMLARAAGAESLADLHAVFDHGAMHLKSGTKAPLSVAITLSTLCTPMALVAVAVIAWRRTRQLDVMHGALVVASSLLLAVLLTSKVLSPQFIIWLLPPLCALSSRDDRPKGFTAALLLAALLTGFIAKFAYRALIEMDLIAILLLTARNAVLVFLLLSLLLPARREIGRSRQPSRFALSPALTGLVVAAAIAVVVVVANARDVSSTDFWLHRRIGEDILATYTIPRVDLYAHTTLGQPYVAHEWLSGVVLYVVDARGGSAALVALRIALVLVIVFAAIRATPRALRRHAAAVPIALAALAVVEARSEVRPHLMALACLAILLALARRERWPSTSGRWFTSIALLHVVWANLHASVFLGPVLLALAAAIEALPSARDRRERGGGGLRRRVRSRAFALAAVVAVLASFVNPHGPKLIVFSLTTSMSPALRDFIHEWRPLWAVWSPGVSNLCFVTLFALLLACAPFLARARRERAWLVASLGLFAAAVWANRFQAEAALVGAPVILAGVARALRLLRVHTVRGTAPPIACVVVMLLLVGGSPLGTGYGPVPDAATAALARTARELQLRGAVLNEYNDGGYLISELNRPSPSLDIHQVNVRPVMDGRLDVHGAARFAAWRAAWSTPDTVWRYAIDHQVVAVLIDAADRALLPALRHDARWRIAFEDPQRVLFVRAPRSDE